MTPFDIICAQIPEYVFVIDPRAPEDSVSDTV